jgi:hypothetical protein
MIFSAMSKKIIQIQNFQKADKHKRFAVGCGSSVGRLFGRHGLVMPWASRLQEFVQF